MNAARDYGLIAIAGVVLALLPTATHSNTVINALVPVMIIGLAAQGWTLPAGYGGSFSFGLACFFRSRAYGMPSADPLRHQCLCGDAGGDGDRSDGRRRHRLFEFPLGARGSYFALITLAFAEVFRIIANATPLTGGAAGTLIKLKLSGANFQFASRAIYFWIILALVVAAMLLMRRIERSRFGAYLVAVRENENSASALGVDTLTVKLEAITLSAGLTALAGAFYVQYFLFVDSTIAFGTWISIEALLAPIVGNLGTVFSPARRAGAVFFSANSPATPAAVPASIALFGSCWC